MKQMTRQLLGACAAIALMSGAAFAQNAPATDAPSTPPAMGATDAPGTPLPNMNAPATGDHPASDAGTNSGGMAADQAPPVSEGGPNTGSMATDSTPAMPQGGTDSGSSTGTGMATDSAPAVPEGGAASGAGTGMATDSAPASPAIPPAATAESTTPANDATTMPSTTTAETEKSGEPVSGDDMIGRTVVGSDGESLGSVSDVIVDSASGKIKQFIIASGGFLGIGAKNVAVDFDDVTIEPEGGLRATNLTQDDIEGLPEFDVSAETKTLDEKMPEPAAGPAPMGATPSPAPAAQ